MRANQDIDVASQTAGGNTIDFLLAALSGDYVDADRPIGKAVSKRLEMLLGKQGGWHQQDSLLAALDGRECRAHGDFGLAKAHVAADQPVHGALFAHVVQCLFDGNALIGCYLETKFVGKGLVVVCIGAQPMRLAGGASGIDIQQFRRNINDLFSRFFLGSVPLI